MFEKPEPPRGLTIPICTACDYPLQGLALGTQCPECGKKSVPAQIAIEGISFGDDHEENMPPKTANWIWLALVGGAIALTFLNLNKTWLDQLFKFLFIMMSGAFFWIRYLIRRSTGVPINWPTRIQITANGYFVRTRYRRRRQTWIFASTVFIRPPIPGQPATIEIRNYPDFVTLQFPATRAEAATIAETLRDLTTTGKVPKGQYRPRVEFKESTPPLQHAFEVQPPAN